MTSKITKKTTKFSNFFSKLKLKKKHKNHSRLNLKEKMIILKKINMDKKPIYEIEFSKEFGELSSDYEDTDEECDYKDKDKNIIKPIFIISDDDEFLDSDIE